MDASCAMSGSTAKACHDGGIETNSNGQSTPTNGGSVGRTRRRRVEGRAAVTAGVRAAAAPDIRMRCSRSCHGRRRHGSDSNLVGNGWWIELGWRRSVPLAPVRRSKIATIRGGAAGALLTGLLRAADRWSAVRSSRPECRSVRPQPAPPSAQPWRPFAMEALRPTMPPPRRFPHRSGAWGQTHSAQPVHRAR